MKFMLTIYTQEDGGPEMSEAEVNAYRASWMEFDTEARKRTNVLDGAPLQPSSTATTVRSNESGVTLSDGPFAETKEQLGGYYVIDANNLDEATAMAGMMPNLGIGGSVEVRPVMEM